MLVDGAVVLPAAPRGNILVPRWATVACGLRVRGVTAFASGTPWMARQRSSHTAFETREAWDAEDVRSRCWSPEVRHDLVASIPGIRNPNADLGLTKEYHIWDAIHTPECRRHKVVLSDLLCKSRKCLTTLVDAGSELLLFQLFPVPLLGRPGVTTTADITPAYSSLDGAVPTPFRPVLRSERSLAKSFS